MPREKVDFRDNLQRIDEYFPNKEVLTVADVSRFTGIDRKKIGHDLNESFVKIGKAKYISKVALARIIS